MSNSTPESRAAERDAIAAKYGEVYSPDGPSPEPDGAPHGAHLITDPYDSPTNRLMEMDRRGELEIRPDSVRLKLNGQAQKLTAQVRTGMAGISVAVDEGLPPAEHDITLARNALEALITMARDWSR